MMPPIVKACYNSVFKHINSFQVTLITKYNFSDYISIPDHVLNKLNIGKITLTHFSNLIRISLLYKYGGLWLDSTFLVTGMITLDNTPFLTIREKKIDYDSVHVSKGRWHGNFVAGAPNYYFFKFIFDFLCEYWKKFDYLITYHLYDYSINLAIESFPKIKEVFDNISPINKNNIILHNLNKKFDSAIYNNATDDTHFHKLTWKHTSSKMVNNEITFYGHILEQYQI